MIGIILTCGAFIIIVGLLIIHTVWKQHEMGKGFNSRVHGKKDIEGTPNQQSADAS